jgi:hypothetical protein
MSTFNGISKVRHDQVVRLLGSNFSSSSQQEDEKRRRVSSASKLPLVLPANLALSPSLNPLLKGIEFEYRGLAGPAAFSPTMNTSPKSSPLKVTLLSAVPQKKSSATPEKEKEDVSRKRPSPAKEKDKEDSTNKKNSPDKAAPKKRKPYKKRQEKTTPVESNKQQVTPIFSVSERKAKTALYLQRRLKRSLHHETNYSPRKRFADTRPRVNGRFLKIHDVAPASQSSAVSRTPSAVLAALDVGSSGSSVESNSGCSVESNSSSTNSNSSASTDSSSKPFDESSPDNLSESNSESEVRSRTPASRQFKIEL